MKRNQYKEVNNEKGKSWKEVKNKTKTSIESKKTVKGNKENAKDEQENADAKWKYSWREVKKIIIGILTAILLFKIICNAASKKQDALLLTSEPGESLNVFISLFEGCIYAQYFLYVVRNQTSSKFTRVNKKKEYATWTSFKYIRHW